MTSFLRTLQIQNFLSYGADGDVVEMRPLNVLIGPNASGKSNLLEALAVLRATATDLMAPIREGGGVSEWLWKGGKNGRQTVAKIEATLAYPEGYMPLRYRLSFTSVGQTLEVVDEVIENETARQGEQDAYFFYRYQDGHPALNIKVQEADDAAQYGGRQRRRIRREDLSPDQSVLSQRKDPDLYPEITYVGKQFAGIQLFREWNLGRYTAPRMPQRPDLPGDFLQPDAANLGLVLNYLEHQPGLKHRLISLLQKFCDRVDDITVKVYGGTVQIFIHEKGLAAPIPATRLSDGMLRYLCLLTVLCHPSPPPVICIEEPELGLHPDVLPMMAELLLDASQRCQLVVTTHSDLLVSALSKKPDAVVVCENEPETGTVLQRLDPQRLAKWLEKYSLGDLWLRGEIGGTKW
jgi:predicted ATPase